MKVHSAPPVALNIIIPVYNEEESIPALITRLDEVQQSLVDADTTVTFVDDHSTDRSQELLKSACAENDRFYYLRLARNSGSHVAILAGLGSTQADCAVFMAADLQDPPELIVQMIELWNKGYQVVWAVREDREGISRLDRFFSTTFYTLLNRLGQDKLPPQGSDFALLDRRVVDALLSSVGANPSLFLEIARLGFSQTQLGYIKRKREFGQTKWNWEKKLRAFADAFVSSSYMPLRLMSYLGILCSVFGLLYALFIIVYRLIVGTPVEGWASLMVVVLVFGGIQMVMLGILGEYVWRTLENARRRPLYFIEDSSNFDEDNTKQVAGVVLQSEQAIKNSFVQDQNNHL